MSTVTLILLIVILVAAAADMFFVYSRDLMMLQQNSYRNERYLRWFSQSKESTSMIRLFCMVAFFVMALGRVPAILTYPVVLLILVWQAVSLATRKYKKPLVRTPRVNRIFAVMTLISAVVVLIMWLFAGMREIGRAHV